MTATQYTSLSQGMPHRLYARPVFAARLMATTATIALAGVTPAIGAGNGNSRDDDTQPGNSFAARGQGDKGQIVQGEVQVFDIPAQPLAQALLQFSRETGIELFFDDGIARDIASPGVRGNVSREDALRQLLAGSGLTYRFTNGNTVTLARSESGDGAIQLNPVTVEGLAERARFGDTPPEPGGFKAEYQASATKTPLSLKETPQAVTVTTRDSIEARHSHDVTSALELTAGVGNARAADGGPFAGRGLGGGEGFTLRGEQLDGKRDVRIDGVSVSSNVFDLAAFERVETIKGPSSVMYGQGTLGGFINLVRKKPRADTEMGGSATIGSFDTYRAEADVTGAMVGDRTVTARITAAYEDSGAFIDGVETRIAMLAPSLEARLGERTRVLLELLYQDDVYIPSRGVPLRLEGNEFKAPNVSRSLFAGVPSQEESQAQNFLGTLRIDRELSDQWLSTLILQGGGQARERFFDSYANAGNLTTAGDIYIFSDTSATEDLNWGGELRLDGTVNAFEREHRILFGFEYSRRRTDLAFGYTYLGPGNLYSGNFAAGAILPGGAGNQAFDFDIRTVSSDMAFYGQTVLGLLDKTKLLAGARYDFSTIDRHNNLTGADDKKTDQALTMRLGLTQEVTENISAYATYAESFNPSVNARSVSGGILDPETGRGYELGLKTEWFEGRFGATMAVFEQELDNVPITDPANRNFNINGGLRRTHGLEVEVSGSPYPGFTTGVASTWLDSEFIEVQDENFSLTPDGITERQSSIFASYEVQDGPLQGFGFGGSVVSVGDRILLTGGTNKYVDGYERVDLNLFYRGIQGLDVSFHVRNLLDEIYIERVRDNFQDNFFGSPRAYLFRATAKF